MEQFLNDMYSLSPEALEESIEDEKNKEKIIIKDIVSKKLGIMKYAKLLKIRKEVYSHGFRR